MLEERQEIDKDRERQRERERERRNRGIRQREDRNLPEESQCTAATF